MRALIVDDDAAAGQGIRLGLNTFATVDCVATGEEAITMIGLNRYDIVLLDLMLPDIDGHEVLRRIRALGQDAPVLVLSGLSRPEAKMKAFGGGIDDYLVKPFDHDELVARIKAVVRRDRNPIKSFFRAGPVTLNRESQEVTVHGRLVHLTGKEYAVLELLVLRKGMVLTKDAFLHHLYGGMDEPEVKIVDVFICKLRRKLADAGAGDVITTVWGCGYVVREPSGLFDGGGADKSDVRVPASASF